MRFGDGEVVHVASAGVAGDGRDGVGVAAAPTDAKSWAKEKAEQAKRLIDEARQKVTDAAKKLVDDAKKKIAEQVDKVKQKVNQTIKNAVAAGKKIVTQAARVVVSTVNQVKDAYKAAEAWVVEHKDLLIDIAAVGAGIIAGIACTAATAGAGAVACMIGAAAIVNLAKSAAKGEIHSLGDGLTSLGQGALQGALGAAGGAVGGLIAGKAIGLLGSIGGRMLGGGLAGGISDAATQLLSGQPVDLGSIALSAGIGAAFGGFYKGGAGSKGCKTASHPPPRC